MRPIHSLSLNQHCRQSAAFHIRKWSAVGVAKNTMNVSDSLLLGKFIKEPFTVRTEDARICA